MGSGAWDKEWGMARGGAVKLFGEVKGQSRAFPADVVRQGRTGSIFKLLCVLDLEHFTLVIGPAL
jgi:hypothetical protein